jgi:Zinc finger C-x8-C-x5-C-x3-H type (and similar)/WD domain, G-beta repeat
MSTFGNSNSNFGNSSGGGNRGGGRSSSNYRGGGNSRGGGKSNYRGDGGGRGRGRSAGRDGSTGHTIASTAKLRPCQSFTTTGKCNNNNCRFAHVVTLHGTVAASNAAQGNDGQNNNNYNNNNYNQSNQLVAATSVAIWETQGTIKIFTGSQDHHWRLWNTGGGNFMKEFEHNMHGEVDCLQVVNNFLFCGCESISRALPEVPVGMIHVWNLQQPSQPPLELCLHPTLLPYAHNQCITALCIELDAATGVPTVVSGSRDGAIRVWTFSNNQFTLKESLIGHAREVTGLVYIATGNLLWSSSIDGSLRIWDLNQGGICQHIITRDTMPAGGTQGIGHSNAVTSLLSFTSPSVPGVFILSSSLDSTIKAWNGATGECVASEAHDEGVVTMSLAKDAAGHELLLIGLESGNIMCRNLVQTAKAPAFQLLFTLSTRYSAGHESHVKAIAQGPAATFYSVGADGKMLVWQFTGDLGI